MDKPARSQPRPLADIARKTLNQAFAKQGFASTELVTRWAEIVGVEIAAYCEPERIRWPRPVGGDSPEPGTIMLRVEGPAAVEIQHQCTVILERVNRFFGWQAVGDLRLRQAPLTRRKRATAVARDAAKEAQIAASLTEVADDRLRAALARLGAAVARSRS
jgi:hypothetical protein